jgi:hypothetical protein
MNRDLISELITWKNARDRKPLILKGAREFSNNNILHFILNVQKNKVV